MHVWTIELALYTRPHILLQLQNQQFSTLLLTHSTSPYFSSSPQLRSRLPSVPGSVPRSRFVPRLRDSACLGYRELCQLGEQVSGKCSSSIVFLFFSWWMALHLNSGPHDDARMLPNWAGDMSENWGLG